jgi:AmmeMemoRadiSam system protein B
MRQPIVDGQFYEADETELKKQIESCFKSKFGPGNLPYLERKKHIIGVISPHAGYQFSGPCQAFAYKEIAESTISDVYILLGLSHNGFESCISLEDWQTPLGIIKNDKDLAKKISTSTRLPIDEIPHQNEHSIEVQLPFLQFVNKNKEFKIVPIIINSDININDFAKNLSEIIKNSKKSVIFIASSDFTHYGYNYRFTPFSKDIKQNMYNLDKGAIESIKNLNSDGFLDYIEKTEATICGKYPIAAIIEIAKNLGAKKAELLKYYTSADLFGDYSNAVGYASILLKK